MSRAEQEAGPGVFPHEREEKDHGAVEVQRTRSSGDGDMLKFIGGTIGVIFLIGLLVVIGLLALIF